MRFVRRYLIPRLVQYVLVTWLGITVVFVIPRLLPSDPIESMVATLQAQGAYRDPAAVKQMVDTLRDMYGLEAGLLEQYLSFWKRLLSGDFGPSYFSFPTPVIELIGRSFPWTIGLLLTTTVLSWIIGNVTGGLSGYFTGNGMLKIFDGIVMFVRPIPYYVLGLTLVILFAYLLPLFPFGGGYTIGAQIAFTWDFIKDVLRHAFLPALSLSLLGIAVNHQTMRLIIQGVKEEDYIRYAKIAAVKEQTIFSRYAMRNALLPQITGLTLSLGQIFGGALITEIVFSYPGLGFLLYRAVVNSDYNLIMGITTISIVAITTLILIVDLLYPLFDPRIRFR
ncbi:MAG: ABC transporter permease [Anaerolineae bacterium]|nr:ABC transporter permease [Anaerolineae bacterium]MDW8098152.1 ABC transporter permease [Anaerolineae bacterium]